MGYWDRLDLSLYLFWDLFAVFSGEIKMAIKQITLGELISGTQGDRGPLLTFKWIIDSFPEFDIEPIPVHYCEEANLPFPQISEKQKTVAATNIFFAGMSQINSFDVVLYEDQAARSMSYILNWQDNIQNPQTGGYYPAAYYKRDLKFHLLNTKNEIIFTGTVRNAFPLGIQNLALNYTSSDRQKLNVNFACDAFVPTSDTY